MIYEGFESPLPLGFPTSLSRIYLILSFHLHSICLSFKIYKESRPTNAIRLSRDLSRNCPFYRHRLSADLVLTQSLFFVPQSRYYFFILSYSFNINCSFTARYCRFRHHVAARAREALEKLRQRGALDEALARALAVPHSFLSKFPLIILSFSMFLISHNSDNNVINIQEILGPHSQFREGQRDAVIAPLGGLDAVVVWPTSAGKSLVYLVALKVLQIEEVRGTVILIEPTQALMNDQFRAAVSVNLATKVLNSNTSQADRDEIEQPLAEGTLQLCTFSL